MNYGMGRARAADKDRVTLMPGLANRRGPGEVFQINNIEDRALRVPVYNTLLGLH